MANECIEPDGLRCASSTAHAGVIPFQPMSILSSKEQQQIRISIRTQYGNDPESKLRIPEALTGAYAIIIKTLGIE